MTLKEFLGATFSDTGRPNDQGVLLSQQYKKLHEAFERFGHHVANCGVDPQFFAQDVKADTSTLNNALLTLTVFGGTQIRLCFDAIQSKQDVRGKVTCFLLRGYDIAQDGEQAKRRELGSWEFAEDGQTDIGLSKGDPLKMTEPAEAVALAVGVLLAAYSEKGVEAVSK